MTTPYDALAFMAALGFASLFMALRFVPFFKFRPFIKAGMATALAVMCFAAPSPLLWMGVGFGMSALGDFFLDLRDEKWFMAGLIAFFLAHVAFLIFLVGLMMPIEKFTSVEWAMVVGLSVVTLGFFVWIKQGLPKGLSVPVAAYMVILTLMGIAALTTTGSPLIPLGALLFIASDMLLAVDKFKTPIPLGGQMNWALYSSGQLLLALGAVWSV